MKTGVFKQIEEEINNGFISISLYPSNNEFVNYDYKSLSPNWKLFENLKSDYDSGEGDDLGADFFTPCLTYCNKYDRATSDFTSNVIFEWGEAVLKLVDIDNHKCKIRMVAHHKLHDDDKKIFDTAKKFGAKCIMTSSHHTNGTERIFEAYKKISKKKKFDLIVDIQGDEPLVSPYHIDAVINHHLKNLNYDILDLDLNICTKEQLQQHTASNSSVYHNFIAKPK